MATLKIVKLGSNKFQHIQDSNTANAFFISAFTANLNGNLFNIVEVDGAVRPSYDILNITIQDASTGGSDETFTNPVSFWNRLISLQYTPFFVVPAGLSLDEFDAINGANSPSATNAFVTIADISTGSGIQSVTGDLVDNTDPINPIINTPNIDQVLTVNNETDKTLKIRELQLRNDAYEEGLYGRIFFEDGLVMKDAGGRTIYLSDLSTSGHSFGNIDGFFAQLDLSLLTITRVILFQNKNGTIAFLDDIPTSLSQLTADSTHRTVTDTEKATWNGKQNALGFTPEDSANKSTSTTDSSSTTKFPVWSVILSYFSTSRIKTLLGQATTSVDGWLSSTDWNTFNNKQSALGYTAENTANKSTNVDTDKTSNTKYSTPKSIYDWAIALFAAKSMSAYSFRVNDTNATANATETTYKSIAEQSFSPTVTWGGTTAPSGALTANYSWIQIGNQVTVRMNFTYSVAGTAITSMLFSLMSDLPTPFVPSGTNNSNAFLYSGIASMLISQTNAASTYYKASIRRNSANNGFDVYIAGASVGVTYINATITYLTN
ncbi:hypothetical protein OX284_014280 [Flavobacterium sp. SUN046]|uniref:hypothetical protein n=1 Tax=Flavobacterium sp. SUN046 TaxID=3002440 RepID=UPI002DB84041|nr:hypothetical protein [Flavobacterium sp. SUN046]MEC4050603.1 hypothetical protein [Flavobacterium sp. SUN046]